MSDTDNRSQPAGSAQGKADAPVFRPQTVEQVISILNKLNVQSGAHHAKAPLLMAGGTDLYPAHVGRGMSAPMIDLAGVKTLDEAERVSIDGQDFIKIGALVRWSELRDRRITWLASPAYDVLAMAAAEIGGRQIQNRATLAGNLCNASPAADGAPALMALNASVLLAGPGGSRQLPLQRFIIGPRRTARLPEELVEAILIPELPPTQTRRHSVFLKLGHRRYLVISAVMVGISLSWSEARVPQLIGSAIAVGSCGPVAARLSKLERRINGLTSDQLAAFAVHPLAPELTDELIPIDDMRGTATYRLRAAREMICRALMAMSAAPGDSMMLDRSLESS